MYILYSLERMHFKHSTHENDDNPLFISMPVSTRLDLIKSLN